MELELIFSQIIITDKNPYTIEIEEVFKKDGEILKSSRKESYILKPFSDLESDIIRHIIENSEIKKIKYPINFIQRIYKKNELSSLLISDDSLAISNNKILKLIRCKNKLEVNLDKLIISDRRQRIFINKEQKSFYFSLDGFQIFEIN